MTIQRFPFLKKWWRLTACLLSAVCSWHSAGGQTATPQTPPAEAAPSGASPAVASPGGAADPLIAYRAPLLREGSYIVDARATINLDPARGWWKLIIDQPDPNLPANELRLLPSTRLTEMQRIAEASHGRQVVFQVTGPVFVFRGNNYLLPTHAPVLMEQETASPSRPAPAPKIPLPSAPDEKTKSPESGGDSVEDIMRRLEGAAGPLPRNPSAAAPPAAKTEPGPQGGASDGRPESPGISGAAGGGAAIGGNGNGHARPHKILSEESSIVSRRGKITRDSSGGWMFVFDADANGQADPPMRLLPCLLLERIEDYARRQGNNSPALINGAVYLYGGQNYLLPTVFRIPQDRRNITP